VRDAGSFKFDKYLREFSEKEERRRNSLSKMSFSSQDEFLFPRVSFLERFSGLSLLVKRSGRSKVASFNLRSITVLLARTLCKERSAFGLLFSLKQR